MHFWNHNEKMSDKSWIIADNNYKLLVIGFIAPIRLSKGLPHYEKCSHLLAFVHQVIYIYIYSLLA